MQFSELWNNTGIHLTNVWSVAEALAAWCKEQRRLYACARLQYLPSCTTLYNPVQSGSVLKHPLNVAMVWDIHQLCVMDLHLGVKFVFFSLIYFSFLIFFNVRMSSYRFKRHICKQTVMWESSVCVSIYQSITSFCWRAWTDDTCGS